MQENFDPIDENNQFNKIRKKRRSKNDTEGRQFQCPNCEKTYLSEIAFKQPQEDKTPSSHRRRE